MGMEEDVFEFDFIDLFDGLDHQSIRYNTLQFVGLDQEGFSNIRKVSKQKFVAEKKKLLKKAEYSICAIPGSHSSSNFLSFPSVALEVHSPVLAVNREQALQRPVEALPLSLWQTALNENNHKQSDRCISQDESSEPMLLLSSEFNDIERSYGNGHSLKRQKLTNDSSIYLNSSMFENRSSSPFTDVNSSLQASKKVQIERPSSGDFKPINSEIQPLTSDEVLDF